jgi:hypothetical protein
MENQWSYCAWRQKVICLWLQLWWSSIGKRKSWARNDEEDFKLNKCDNFLSAWIKFANILHFEEAFIVQQIRLNQSFLCVYCNDGFDCIMMCFINTSEVHLLEEYPLVFCQLFKREGRLILCIFNQISFYFVKIFKAFKHDASRFKSSLAIKRVH